MLPDLDGSRGHPGSPTALLAATAYLPLLVLTLASLLLYRRWQWRAEAAVEAGWPLPDLRSARDLAFWC